MDEAHKYLMESGTPSVSFKDAEMRGTWVHGTILKLDKTQQTDFDSGKPMWWDEAETQPKWQLVFTLQTEQRNGDDDDGVRNLYAKGQMIAAIKSAIKETGHEGEVVGGKLGIVWYGEGEATGKKNPPKLYKAKFAAPSATEAIDTADENEPAESAPAPEPQYDPGEEPF